MDGRSEALVLVAECAEGRGFGTEAYGTDQLLLAVDVPHVDGVLLPYRIIVGTRGTQLVVKEDPTSPALPQFCPERHIIGGGEFCMYWDRDLSFTVIDAESAARWMGLLLNFLRLQRRAATQRFWPNSETWAHGVSAAVRQRQAEQAAAKLGTPLKIALAERRLRVTEEVRNTFRVHQGGRLLFSAWRSPNRRNRRGEPLPCAVEARGSKRTSTHGSRAELLYELGRALFLWQEKEQAFWDCHRNMVCCGTIDNCPLRVCEGDDVNEA